MLTYWRFYWPLALTGVAMVLSVQFQNGALARYPDAVTELAVFALAYGTFAFFRASLHFVSQLSNVYARSREGTRRTFRFVLTAGLILTVPLLALGHLEGGRAFLNAAYSIDREIGDRVAEYLVYLAPLVIVTALRFYYTGLLVQARLTGAVTVLNVMFLTVVIVGLIAGFSSGLRPVVVLVGSEALATLLHLAGSVAVYRRSYRAPLVAEHEQVSYRELTGFFIPVSLTGVMFALSRPVLFAFMSRAPGGLAAIAAMRVAFDFATIFQQAANQFRHFFVTFGLDDLPRKRRFMVIVCTGITLIMLVFSVTPLADVIWRDLMRIPDDVRALSVDVMLVMCLMPAVIVFRNYFHGRLMVERRTVGMAAGALLRVGAIYLMAQGLFVAGWLSHITASAALILGFVVEAGVVLWAAARPAGPGQNGSGSRV